MHTFHSRANCIRKKVGLFVTATVKVIVIRCLEAASVWSIKLEYSVLGASLLTLWT